MAGESTGRKGYERAWELIERNRARVAAQQAERTAALWLAVAVEARLRRERIQRELNALADEDWRAEQAGA